MRILPLRCNERYDGPEPIASDILALEHNPAWMKILHKLQRMASYSANPSILKHSDTDIARDAIQSAAIYKALEEVDAIMKSTNTKER